MLTYTKQQALYINVERLLFIENKRYYLVNKKCSQNVINILGAFRFL